jgi:hypothetical protein
MSDSGARPLFWIDIDALAEAIATRLEIATPWMTVAEAAEYFRCSERWIRDRLYEIPHRRIDGRIVLHKAELNEWSTRYRRGSTAPATNGRQTR